jgi:hypothetical protein
VLQSKASPFEASKFSNSNEREEDRADSSFSFTFLSYHHFITSKALPRSLSHEIWLIPILPSSSSLAVISFIPSTKKVAFGPQSLQAKVTSRSALLRFADILCFSFQDVFLYALRLNIPSYAMSHIVRHGFGGIEELQSLLRNIFLSSVSLSLGAVGCVPLGCIIRNSLGKFYPISPFICTTITRQSHCKAFSLSILKRV